MEAVTKEGFRDRRRRKLSNGHVFAQLLEAPLPTPRRSCCGSTVDATAILRRGTGTAEVSPQRRHVPFSWETSPGVAKSAATGRTNREVPPPKPPPGRCGTPCRSYRETTTTDGSSEEDGGGDTFSDALERTSSSDRLAALSARLSSIDGVAMSRRLSSFVMDRFLPAANAIATTSADKHPKRPSPRRSVRRSEDDEEAVARARQVMNSPRCALARKHSKQEQLQQSPRRQSTDEAAPGPLSPSPRVNNDADDQGKDDETSARACGLMLFFPWRAKPVLLSFAVSSPRRRTSNASVASVTAPSPPRRSVTLGDVLEKERKLRDGDLSHWYDEEKSGDGKESLSRVGWGTALLGTSKRYCTDARKALSRMARSATDGGRSPRLCRERRSGRQAASATHVTSDRIPPLSPPSESWLSHARRSNAV